MKLIIHTDGGSRGNPGEAAVGIVIRSRDQKEATIATLGKRIGIKTNNEAEYMGVIIALEEVIRRNLNPKAIEFVLDSLLVVSQLNGTYKIKQAHLQELLLKIRNLEQELGISPYYRHVLRGENAEADSLVNKALDSA